MTSQPDETSAARRIEEMLQREPESLPDEINSRFSDRVVLVTGAAGSIGSEVCEQLLHAGLNSLILLDHDENGLSMLARRLTIKHPGAALAVELGSVRDLERVRSIVARHQPHELFHAAAVKHVCLAEAAPCEAVKNNIMGTAHVTRVAHELGVERFLYISTDKAVRPVSVMGATKRVGEELVHARGRCSSTRFCVVRFGNVFGSAGSVVPIFREQIAGGGPVTVTSPDVRRYFMTVNEAVALLLRVAYSDYGELCVLDMGEPIRILDLARYMITAAGLTPEADVPIEFTGLQPGEKLYEEMLNEEERPHRVHPRILAVDRPAPPPDLERQVLELIEAAKTGQTERILHLLRRVVPSYGGGAAAAIAPPEAESDRST